MHYSCIRAVMWKPAEAAWLQARCHVWSAVRQQVTVEMPEAWPLEWENDDFVSVHGVHQHGSDIQIQNEFLCFSATKQHLCLTWHPALQNIESETPKLSMLFFTHSLSQKIFLPVLHKGASDLMQIFLRSWGHEEILKGEAEANDKWKVMIIHNGQTLQVWKRFPSHTLKA